MLVFLLATAALAHEPVSPDGQPVPHDVSGHAAFVWQGFEHEWERRVAGAWAVPHRVSLFSTGTRNEQHTPTKGGVASSAEWHFAQSTGVDGDRMEPIGYYTHLYAPAVNMHRGSSRFVTNDEVDVSKAPQALARFRDHVKVPRTEGEEVAVALVSGLAFASKCLDGDGACNSDGIWPYRFSVELAECDAVEDSWSCPVEVEVGRAWTPAKGGVRPIEVKPTAEHMALEVELEWLVMTSTPDQLNPTRVFFENALPTTQRIVHAEQTMEIPASGDGSYANALVGWTAFGFEFVPTGKRSALERRGRYLAGWGMRARALDYDPATGITTVGHAGGIWLPRSVVRTGVRIELGMAVLQLGDDVELRQGTVSGRLCRDSHDAPFFSRWERCEKLSGNEQLEDVVEVREP